MNIEIYEDTYNIAVNQYLSRKTAGSKRRKEAFRSKKRRSRVLRDKYGFIADGNMSYSEFKEALSSKQTSKMPRRIVDGILLQTVSNTVYWICPGEVEVQQDNDDGTGWF